MRNIAPSIFRQRLLIEGFYRTTVNKKLIRSYFAKVTKELGLKAYGEPTIFSPGGKGKEMNQGFDAFVPLIDSGISLYVWSHARFLSMLIYSCKHFDERKALVVTKKFFAIKHAESLTI